MFAREPTFRATKPICCARSPAICGSPSSSTATRAFTCCCRNPVCEFHLSPRPRWERATLMRRRPAGWRRRWRRSGQAGVEAGTASHAAMNRVFACRQFLRRRRNNRSALKALRESGPARLTCRDDWRNSNARIVRPAPGSGFIAAIASPTVKIFSAKNGKEGSIRRPYPGANPNVRSKRLA